MMFKSCSVCGKFRTEDNMCKRIYKSKKQSVANRFRNTNAWIIKREIIKKRDKYFCQLCLIENRYVYSNLQVHHIVSIEDDNSKRLDSLNLITLCSRHHKDAESGLISVNELINLIDK